MLVGHYATALFARQRMPQGHLGYYLVASQLPDLLWQLFAWIGLEPTHPDHVMEVSLDSLHVDMSYSHDLVPMLGWTVLIAVLGRVWFRAWKPGLVGGALVLGHAATDYLAGYPHNLCGPHSPVVGSGLYHSAPYLAVGIEALFTAGVMGWVLATDRRQGRRRSRLGYGLWAWVFVGGLLFSFASADLTLVELTGWAPPPALEGSTVPVLTLNYLVFIVALLIAGRPSPSAAMTPPSV